MFSQNIEATNQICRNRGLELSNDKGTPLNSVGDFYPLYEFVKTDQGYSASFALKNRSKSMSKEHYFTLIVSWQYKRLKVLTGEPITGTTFLTEGLPKVNNVRKRNSFSEREPHLLKKSLILRVYLAVALWRLELAHKPLVKLFINY